MNMYRNMLLVLALAGALTACKQEEKADGDTTGTPQPITETASEGTTGSAAADDAPIDPATLTKISWAETNVDLGVMKEGEVREHKFTFTNTGDKPLKILKAKGSCGCTTPEFSKEPVAPGATGFITARFDSKGKPGTVRKSVTVETNTEPRISTLNFKVEVTPAPQGAAEPAEKH